MKTFKTFLAAIVCLTLTPFNSFAADHPIVANQLPAAAKQFIAKNFPGKTIAYAEKDTEYMKTTYEVSLNDGTKIDFNGQGVWDKVDTHTTPVPAAIVPAAIQQYVSAHFRGQVITKVDKERHGYDIELSNGMDLKFNRGGAFMGIDD